MVQAPKQNTFTMALPSPLVLNWSDLTAEQVEASVQRFKSRGKPTNDGSYRVSVLIDPVSQGNVLQALQQGVVQWMSLNPGHGNQVLLKDLNPGKDANFPNHVSLDMKSKYPPYLIGPDGNPCEASRFYRGCIVHVGVIFRYTESPFGRGVTLSAESVRFVADGVPLGGGGATPVEAANRLASVPTSLPPGFVMPVPASSQQAAGMTVNAPPAFGQPINQYPPQQAGYYIPSPVAQPVAQPQWPQQVTHGGF